MATAQDGIRAIRAEGARSAVTVLGAGVAAAGVAGAVAAAVDGAVTVAVAGAASGARTVPIKHIARWDGAGCCRGGGNRVSS